MEETTLLALPEGMKIEQIQITATGLLIQVAATTPTARCPLCCESSSSIHCHYHRTLRDVPCAGRRVQLLLTVRKFTCRNLYCERKVFAERFPDFVEPWARATIRFCQHITSIGLATCGKGGAKLAARLGIQTTRQTILRRIMDLPDLPTGSILFLGIDDFSFKRGRRFGTILINLETRRVVDLLPDRKAETAASWMYQHPDLMAVSRDRGGEYAAAATAGAPQATQYADRFHLMKNLGEALEGLLARHLAAHRKKEAQASDEFAHLWRTQSTKRTPKLEQLQQARREERLARYEQVITLRKQRLSYQAIAGRVGMGASTVQSWLAAGRFPERKPREQGNLLDRYLPYVVQRWEQGCHNITQIYQELLARGYKGSYASVYDNLVRHFPAGRKFSKDDAALQVAPVLSRQGAFLFLRQSEKLEAREQETLVLLRQFHPEVDLAYGLVQQFTQILRERRGKRLDDWLEQVKRSHIPELQSFAAGIEKDKDAVRSGLTWWINNGMVEGHVTKLKLIKRQGYGKAGFPLLRKRVLHAP